MTEPREIAAAAEEVVPGLWTWSIANSAIGGHVSTSQAVLTRGGCLLVDPVRLDEAALGALGAVVDGAGDEFLAGAALAGDEDADVHVGDSSGEPHCVAHVANGHGAVVTGWEFVDRPERGAFFTFVAGAFQIVDGCQQQGDGVEGCD